MVCKKKTGSDIDIGDLVYEPPRDGPTLWEIGIPDRSAAQFYVPDPNPKYINNLYVNHPDKSVPTYINNQLNLSFNISSFVVPKLNLEFQYL